MKGAVIFRNMAEETVDCVVFMIMSSPFSLVKSKLYQIISFFLYLFYLFIYFLFICMLVALNDTKLLHKIDVTIQKLQVMHMSSASPRGRTPGQPGEYVGEYKDGLDSLPLGRGKFARCFQIRRKGVGEYEIL